MNGQEEGVECSLHVPSVEGLHGIPILLVGLRLLEGGANGRGVVVTLSKVLDFRAYEDVVALNRIFRVKPCSEVQRERAT